MGSSCSSSAAVSPAPEKQFSAAARKRSVEAQRLQWNARARMTQKFGELENEKVEISPAKPGTAAAAPPGISWTELGTARDRLTNAIADRAEPRPLTGAARILHEAARGPGLIIDLNWARNAEFARETPSPSKMAELNWTS